MFEGRVNNGIEEDYHHVFGLFLLGLKIEALTRVNQPVFRGIVLQSVVPYFQLRVEIACVAIKGVVKVT